MESAVIRSRIIDTPGVNRLIDYTSAVNVDTRHMTVNAEIDTIYGQTRFAQELEGMSDFAPTISAAGIDAPDFAQILAVLNERVREIFGDDIYIEPDSQDGQLLGVYSLALSDLNAAAVAVYNAFSPATAQGNGLSSVVKINGLRRKLPSRSQAEVRSAA